MWERHLSPKYKLTAICFGSKVTRRRVDKLLSNETRVNTYRIDIGDILPFNTNEVPFFSQQIKEVKTKKSNKTFLKSSFSLDIFKSLIA